MANHNELAELQSKLSALPTATAPAALEQRVMASLARIDAAPQVTYLRHRRWYARPAAQAGFALAACSAMLFLWFFWLGEGSPERTQQAPGFAVDSPPPATSSAADEIARLQAASADLEQVLISEQQQTQVYGNDQAWVEHNLQVALHQVDADLAAAPSEDEKVQLWTQRVALLAGLTEQSLGTPLGSGVEWVQLN